MLLRRGSDTYLDCREFFYAPRVLGLMTGKKIAPPHSDPTPTPRQVASLPMARSSRVRALAHCAALCTRGGGGGNSRAAPSHRGLGGHGGHQLPCCYGGLPIAASWGINSADGKPFHARQLPTHPPPRASALARWNLRVKSPSIQFWCVCLLELFGNRTSKFTITFTVSAYFCFPGSPKQKPHDIYGVNYLKDPIDCNTRH